MMRAARWSACLLLLVMSGANAAFAAPPLTESEDFKPVPVKIVAYDAQASFSTKHDVHALVENAQTLLGIKGIPLTFRFHEGRRSVELHAVTDEYGNASVAFDPPEWWAPGTDTYTVESPEIPDRLHAAKAVASITVPAITLELKMPGEKANAGDKATFNAFFSSYDGAAPDGMVTFTVAGTDVGHVPAKNGGAKLVYTVPADAAAGVTLPVVARFDGLPRYGTPVAKATLTVLARMVSLTVDSPALAAEPNQTLHLSGELSSREKAVPNVAVAFTVDGTAACTATTDGFGVAQCPYKLPASLTPGQHTIAATSAAGSNVKGDSGEATFTLGPPKPQKIAHGFVQTVYAALVSSLQLHLNNYTENRHGDSWYVPNDSWFAVGQTVVHFDIPEAPFGGFKYYIRSFDLQSQTAEIVGGKIRLTFHFGSGLTPIIGRCGGALYCAGSDDDIAPDVDISNAVATIDLTPVAYHGSISFGEAVAHFSAGFDIHFAPCHVAGDICKAVYNYKDLVPGMIEKALNKQLNNGNIAREAVKTAFDLGVDRHLRPVVTKAWMTPEGDIMYLASLAP